MFSEELLRTLESELSQLDEAARFEYRNRNSNAIVVHESPHLLILAGPGTGKSFLFRDRIKYWLPRHSEEAVYVSSFVRKLVADLRVEIEQDDEFEPVEWIKAARRTREKYTLTGSDAQTGFKIGDNEYPEKIYEALVPA